MVEQQEHADDVLRLRNGLRIGLVVWTVFVFFDWFVVSRTGQDVVPLVVVRVAGLAIGLLILLRFERKPQPSPAMLRFADIFVFTTAAALISVMCLAHGGIASPLAGGIPVVLVARAAALTHNWRRAVTPIATTALAFPIVLAAATPASPGLQTQLGDTQALSAFAVSLFFIAATAAITLAGGHATWALRRKVFETRSIGRYRLQQLIGQGGMGEVWRAHHSGLGRTVALKILRPDRSRDPVWISRFEREVKASTELQHPNTVRVFDFGVTDDGLCYFAMEYLEGEDLGHLVLREGALSPNRAVRLMHQAARALGEAHAHGIIHRDIKPANLFVTNAGGEHDFLKVLDFGIARFGTEPGQTLTDTGWVAGTPGYIAPEVATGTRADPRSDVYALGAVLYFLLAGRPPFDTTDPRALLAAHVSALPPAPSARLGRPLPSSLEAVVMRCLSKNPEARYASAAELAAALASHMRGAWDEGKATTIPGN